MLIEEKDSTDWFTHALHPQGSEPYYHFRRHYHRLGMDEEMDRLVQDAKDIIKTIKYI